MNTHDRIELPPLPYPYDTPAYRTVGAVIQEYARAAIKADRQKRGETYNYKRIGWELERTAMGDGFYGNALRVAKDIPGVSEEDREVLDRYAAGKQQGMDHVALQNIALNIYTIPQPDTPEQEPALDVSVLVEALDGAARSLETISRQAGIDEYMRDFSEVRGMHEIAPWWRSKPSPPTESKETKMKIHKVIIKLKGKFKCEHYTKSFPAKKKLIMDAWYRYSDGFESTDEEFEEFKNRIQYKVKLINVGE